jgi:D-glycero-D-manno-heptose 1,7-bisphosphate phosphatase
MPQAAIFLDRDGTITVDTGYIFRVDEMEFMPNAVEGLLALKELDRPFVVVSNQGGIGLGKFNERDLFAYNAELARRLQEFDIRIHAWYHSPFHPQAIHPHLLGESECRKPAPGMLLRAAREHDLDLKSSWMIGDRHSDVEAGMRAGCRAIRLSSEPDGSAPTTTFTAPDLLAASRIICGASPQGS